MNAIPSKIKEQLTKVIIGKDELIGMTLAAIFAGGHVLLEDVPGTGKTTLALGISRSLGLDFRRIQLTPDTVASDITGYSAFDSGKQEFIYHPGAAMTNLLLADELNRTSGKTQAALLEAMEEGRMTVDGITYDLPRPFNVIATQNPSGTAGTSAIPLSQLDRFMVRLRAGSPDRAALKRILSDRSTGDPLDSVECVCTAEQLSEIVRECSLVKVSGEIYDYVCDLVQAAQDDERIDGGISPRGALALCRLAKAVAYLEGRDYVVPMDIRSCFEPVCAHRIVLTRETRASGKCAEDILHEIVEKVPCPENGGKK